MAALIKTLARKQIRRGEKLIKARNIGFQKHTLRLWHGPDYGAHGIHTPQAYWLRQCLICFPQPTRSTLQFTREGVRGKDRERLTAESRDESIGFRSGSTVYRTESASWSWVSMAVPKEKEEMARENKKPKISRLKRKRGEEETIFCICTRRAAAWFSRGFIFSLKALLIDIQSRLTIKVRFVACCVDPPLTGIQVNPDPSTCRPRLRFTKRFPSPLGGQKGVNTAKTATA